MSSHTVPEKIVLSANELDKEKGTFTAEDLIVRCWEKFNDTFGLQGYASKFPDSNRVLTNIMGTKGVRGKGWLRKVGEKRYQLTEVGRQVANEIGESPSQRVLRGASLGRETIDILSRLVESRAMQKFRLRQELSFGDLCTFWNVSARSNAYQLNVAMKESEAAIEAGEAYLVENGGDSQAIAGTSLPITKSDLSLARALAEELKKTFGKELSVIRERSDERLPR